MGARSANRYTAARSRPNRLVLALGGAISGETLRRAGSNLRALIYDPESRLSSATIRILEDILVGIDHE